MATVTLTVTAGGNFGSQCRKLAKAIEKVASDVPDVNATGASSVLTLDNGTGFCTVSITGGPYTNAAQAVTV